ncbi:MAG: ABC transporter permease [Saprospiraceae bacterium]|nr:ABC transporter permease [Saprospiraceae bacterium]
MKIEEGRLISGVPEWDQILKPSSGWQSVDWRELYRYRDLLYFLVLRGIKAKYAQSVLGIGWAIIQPLFTTLVFTVVFGNLAGISSDGVPYIVFSFAAMVPWNYFSGTLTDAATSLVTNASMITKVYFPRIVLPLSAAFAKLLDFLIGMVVMAGFMVYYGFVPGWEMLLLPLLIAILLFCSLGLGMILSAMAVQYRDVKHASTFMVQLLMYAAPVVYPASKVPDAWLFWYSLNPMVGVIEGFRSALLDTQPMPWDLMLEGGLVSLALFVFGAYYFRRMEKVFADVA